YFIQVSLSRDVGKSPVVIVVVEARRRAGIGKSQVVRRDIANAFDRIAGDKYIRPAIIIVIPEPGGKAFNRLSDSSRLTHIRELPRALRSAILIARPVVPIKDVWLPFAREVEIGPAVVVKIAGGH